MHVLVCDDDTAVGAAWARLLSMAGHSFDCVGRLAELRRALKTARYDMMVTEMNLHGQSVLTISDYACYAQPDMAVVLITASTALSTPEVYRMVPNLRLVMRKPLSCTDFAAIVEHLSARCRPGRGSLPAPQAHAAL